MTPKQNIILALGAGIIIYDLYKQGVFSSNTSSSVQTKNSNTVAGTVTKKVQQVKILTPFTFGHTNVNPGW